MRALPAPAARSPSSAVSASPPCPKTRSCERPWDQSEGEGKEISARRNEKGETKQQERTFIPVNACRIGVQSFPRFFCSWAGSELMASTICSGDSKVSRGRLVKMRTARWRVGTGEGEISRALEKRKELSERERKRSSRYVLRTFFLTALASSVLRFASSKRKGLRAMSLRKVRRT